MAALIQRQVQTLVHAGSLEETGAAEPWRQLPVVVGSHFFRGKHCMAPPDRLYPGTIGLMWLAWFVYWRISAANTKATQQVESALSRASHIVPVLVGGLL